MERSRRRRRRSSGPQGQRRTFQRVCAAFFTAGFPGNGQVPKEVQSRAQAQAMSSWSGEVLLQEMPGQGHMRAWKAEVQMHGKRR